ncbi:CAF17-like 4Fe-4S cluster assembly/insertion protein YgfZ [Paucibacter soli]|uniref:CAF17-like 4Fe-4S cluster assembly/insertion protein YgfZ n=1 Tax=Paucibacter soli TaxID=3133433 RepID=UPI003097A383
MNQEIATFAGAALRLNQFGVIRAAGAEAAKFLHSQLTQDFALLGDGQARLAGYCSAKGRLLATLVGWKNGPEELLLVLPLELLAPTLKRLSMFVMRAKCKLSDATAEFQLWGLAGAQASAWLGAAAPTQTWDLAAFNEGQVLRLPTSSGQARYLLALPASAAAPDLPAMSAADWQWLDVQSGLAWVQAATVEQFVPQMLNLELLGGVNFQKGCYPGQEVVARSQYRGTLKRRTFLFETAAPALVGQEIFHSEDPGQPAGLVAAVAERNGRALLLAETKIAALEGGSLHLGRVDGAPLEPRALPYELREPQ